MAQWQILEGDSRTVLATLEAGSVHTVVTSPPYYGLRDYAVNGQLGLEATPDAYVASLVDVFRQVRRVLRDDGTVWLNLGDSYYSPTATQGRNENRSVISTLADHGTNGRSPALDSQTSSTYRRNVTGMKPKDLLGIPWMVAFALRQDGWYLRADIIWAKPNPMPESVTDRPTKAHEYLFLLTKRPRYFYDADAIREPQDPNSGWAKQRARGENTWAYTYSDQWADEHPQTERTAESLNGSATFGNPAGRNKRSVWTVATQPYPGAHFATFPPKLIEPCVLAGSPERACDECGAPWERVTEREETIQTRPQRNGMPRMDGYNEQPRAGGQSGLVEAGYGAQFPKRTLGFAPSCTHDAPTTAGVVLDPFCGAGTTGIVATRHNRAFVGIELSPTYADMARWRIRDDAPLFNTVNETAV